jgi:hypothetical protein
VEDLHSIITRDMEAAVREAEAKAADYRRLMRVHPLSKDWARWERKEERAERQAARYRKAIELRRRGQ